MPLFRKKEKIQAMGTEGSKQDVDLENLLYASVSTNSIGGVENVYKTYESQVRETYRKYDGMSDWGNQQLRAVADIRSSFISGEGISFVSKDDKFKNWAEEFVKVNRVLGTRFFDLVLGSELSGKALLTLGAKPGEMPKVLRIPYLSDEPYRIKLGNKYDPSDILDIEVKKNTGFESLGLVNFVYIRTGGNDSDVNNTTTKIGVVLSDIENYDRAIKDMRRLNHVTARITPTWKTSSDDETRRLIKELKKIKYRIGQGFVGTAEMDFKTPKTGAHENLKTELSTSIKTISSVTGCPVHWIGWTDLMSNRATAESLYDTLGTATVRERTLIAEGIYDLLIKAQEIYIDSGGTLINTVNRDFEVKIPVMDFSKFFDMVRALSVAYNDGIISRADYQNFLPGIDPIKTEEYLKAEQKEAQQDFIPKTEINMEEEEKENG